MSGTAIRRQRAAVTAYGIHQAPTQRGSLQSIPILHQQTFLAINTLISLNPTDKFHYFYLAQNKVINKASSRKKGKENVFDQVEQIFDHVLSSNKAARSFRLLCKALSNTWSSILRFLQRVSIACYAKRCITYRKSVRPSVCLSVCPSVSRWHCAKTTPATIMRSSLEDSPMTLVSSWLTSAQNSKGNLGSEGAE